MMLADTSVVDLSQTPRPTVPGLVRRLLVANIFSKDRWDQLPHAERELLLYAPDDDTILTNLVRVGLLTPWQQGRVRANEFHTLCLGNYRLLEKIGSGGMGIVYRAEHQTLLQQVAIKALTTSSEHNRRALDRFFREVQAVTQLKHPNIVAALDAGEEAGVGPQGAPVPYLVMDYVPGSNLEDLVMTEGPLTAGRACLIAYQIADALTEAHKQNLVHRDIKPGNVIIRDDGTAMLLDFGVARLPHFDDRLTKYGAQLGTIGYMPPEQVRNARDVDHRADLFGLGATLFFMLTSRDPFDPPAGSAGVLKPPKARDFRSDIRPELDAMLSRFMAIELEKRVPSADAAMRELLPFLEHLKRHDRTAPSDSSLQEARSAVKSDTVNDSHRILVVDDQPDIRRVCRMALAVDGQRMDEAGTGPEALEKLETGDYDLILLDVDLPGFSGEQVLKKLRLLPNGLLPKVIMFSGRVGGDDLCRLLPAGADDYIMKPFSLVQLRARVKAALKLKEAQDRSELLNTHLLTLNAELERNVSHRDSELIHARGAMVLALAKLVEQRSAETGAHLIRLQKYCRVLAEAASKMPGYARRIDSIFIQTLEDCAPLHDIGKVAVPDGILNKPGRLTEEERGIMERHTVAGAETLREVAQRYRFATGFLQTAIDIARSHHEHWDGSGYPDQLAGEAIPLAARLLALCDVYDALRTKRVYKPALSHNMAMMTICEGSPGHFDPGLLSIFRLIGPQFDRINSENND